MGVLDRLFGGKAGRRNDDSERDGRRFAILVNAGPERGATANNAFNYAIELDDEGHDVRLFLDGKGTKWPAEFAKDPDHPFGDKWNTIRNRGLLVGACGYCANAFDQTESIERVNVALLSDSDAHAPSVAELASDGYEILSVG